MNEAAKPEKFGDIAVPLDELDLTKLEWVQVNPTPVGVVRQDRAQQRIRIAEVDFDFYASRIFWEKSLLSEAGEEDINMDVVHASEPGRLEGFIKFRFSQQERRWIAKTQIEKIDIAFPGKGTGTVFYKKMLDLVAAIATSENKMPMVHLVERYPLSSTGHQPLSNTRWNEIFAPILAEYGYVQVAEGFWRKEFLAKTGAGDGE